MTLERTKPRRTITLGGFSFATGTIELYNPYDCPYHILIAFAEDPEALDQYFAYNLDTGMITDEDFTILTELTAHELVELAEMLQEVLDSEPAVPTSPIVSPRDELSAEDEDLLKKFGEILSGLTDTGKEGDEPPC